MGTNDCFDPLVLYDYSTSTTGGADFLVGS